MRQFGEFGQQVRSVKAVVPKARQVNRHAAVIPAKSLEGNQRGEV
jgi:hypothetical protein